ncbi:6-N-hydroxylaminopurine resistance protein [Thalassoglobus neptunius]|uniref:6-N-hydroxylaminopurine resistance protein n=1 Tax=Thalassoglobus neptunius TaxID=1938619 RepID=A0A5C5V0J3_9PLAN|nr:MOSC domain-containing protein [Thalassoglobus neptunius]TWT32164.1 6-N-hydroxylaminopurine resistance protein [Thalassoglobus neptunius]
MILGKIESIQVGRPRRYDSEGDSSKSWTSAIGKCPVQGRVHVGLTNIAGDEQADLKHHGGPDKAVLAYAAKHYDDWNLELPDSPFRAGSFGENLTVSGFSEADCCIGDIMRIGDCELQISQPRQPCWKLSRYWNLPKLTIQVQQTGRTGWYYRVHKEGDIEAGISIELIDRPFPEFTVAWASSVMYAKPRSPDDDLRLAECPALSASWKETLHQRGMKGIEKDSSPRLNGP